jgi:curved DNA-binding protein
MSNPFTTLGVAETATDDEIKSAYRKLAKEHHPDRNGGDDARFKEISAAYEKIATQAKRNEWKQASSPFSQNPHGPNGFRNADAAGGWWQEFAFDDNNPFADRYREIFRRQDEHIRRQMMDRQAAVDIDLISVLNGANVNIEVDPGLETAKTLNVKIPPGIHHGTRLRVPGMGNWVSGKAGDLYLTVRVKPHRAFERNGANLHARVDVDALELMISGAAKIVTLEGEELYFGVPTKVSGSSVRISGYGLPDLERGGERGDLFAVINITVPKDLTDEQKGLLLQVKDLQEKQNSAT